MNDGALDHTDADTCGECGRPLPPATLRYCVHCGAEVAADPRARRARGHALEPEEPASTWATGEFRAPSPLDGVSEFPPIASIAGAQPPSAAGVWYPPAWYQGAEAPATEVFSAAVAESSSPEPLTEALDAPPQASQPPAASAPAASAPAASPPAYPTSAPDGYGVLAATWPDRPDLPVARAPAPVCRTAPSL
jgi:hypothetical protein